MTSESFKFSEWVLGIIKILPENMKLDNYFGRTQVLTFLVLTRTIVTVYYPASQYHFVYTLSCKLFYTKCLQNNSNLVVPFFKRKPLVIWLLDRKWQLTCHLPTWMDTSDLVQL